MSAQDSPPLIQNRKLVAQTENAAVERFKLSNNEELVIKHDLTSSDQPVSVIDFETADIGASDVGTANSDVAVGAAGDVTISGTTEQEVIRRIDDFAYLYERSCNTALYRDHGTVGITFELTEEADKYSKQALGGILCAAIGSALRAIGTIAAITVGGLCSMAAGYVLEQASPEGAYTAGFYDRDSGGWIQTPQVTAGVSGRYDADPSTWTSPPSLPGGVPAAGVHLSPAINELG